MSDLASRLNNRVQIRSDGLRAYVDVIEASFGADVDYATIVKSYEAEAVRLGMYSPPKVVGIDKAVKVGNPVPELISTSYVERGNLKMRMSMRRFTRLTNAFSKKVENLRAAVSLLFAYYNLVRFHKRLQMPPALAAGVSKDLWAIAYFVEMANDSN